MTRQKAFHIFCIVFSLLLSVGFILLGIFVFSQSYVRFWETLCDFGSSAKFYFFEIFGIEHETKATVENFSEVMKIELFMPENWEMFKEYLRDYASFFFNGRNLRAYFRALAIGSKNAARVITVLLPCVLLLYIAIKETYSTGNNNHGKDTRALAGFKKLSGKTYQPLKRIVKGYMEYLKRHPHIPKLWALCWILHLNIGSIIAAFLAYYFYFAVSFRFETMYIQLCKLIIDLQVILFSLPLPVHMAVGYVIFDLFRRKVGLDHLRHMEARNCGFINELPIVSMTVGSMGKKKTTVITDMALSQEVMFRQKALELLRANDMRFPYFPWISFEMDLRNCMEYGTVYNLATVKTWMKKKRERFLKNEDKRSRLYGYDYERYGILYDDGLCVWQLHDIMEKYAQLYFIYVIENSLIVSNYSIRTDARLSDAGNFPLWMSDFFPKKTSMGGRHAHILDFDVLRLGKKVIENNPRAGSFEFGAVVISEVGKERGNILDHKEMKKNNDETNQKNDLFNSWLKMCRHSATVDNFPFIKVFTDEQRPESWGADARDLCDIVHIMSSGKQQLAMPFYTIEEMLTEWAFGSFLSMYNEFRYLRGDNTLLVHILKTIMAWLYRRNARIYNRFGYTVSAIEKERGTRDGKLEKKKYYVMYKKIYARRFSTDCFSDYFNDMARKTKVGLNDYMEYATEKATVDELKMQNSYFIASLYRTTNS